MAWVAVVRQKDITFKTISPYLRVLLSAFSQTQEFICLITVTLYAFFAVCTITLPNLC